MPTWSLIVPTYNRRDVLLRVLPLAFGLAVAVGRLPATAWTIGLGPTPWSARKARPQPKAVPA